ncbi:MAG: hypothetical protein C0596_16920 [Marinilabiliales bacterium]|nr:MAG: hypothetical protein C0596_16920 [Marinilabiliales bacterium]
MFMYYVEAPFTFGLRINFPAKQYLFESGIIVSKFLSKNFSASEIYHREGISIGQEFNNFDLLWSGSFKWCVNPKKKKNILFGLKAVHSIIPINKTYKIYHFDYGIELVYFFI